MLTYMGARWHDSNTKRRGGIDPPQNANGNYPHCLPAVNDYHTTFHYHRTLLTDQLRGLKCQMIKSKLQ